VSIFPPSFYGGQYFFLCRGELIQRLIITANGEFFMVWQKEVRVFHTVDGIRESIDQISDDSFFSYGWFKTLESFGMLPDPLYLAVAHDGNTIGIAPCFIDKINDFLTWGPNILPFLPRVLNFGQRLDFFKRNVLLCYSPACCRTKVLFANNYSAKMILSLFSEKIDDLCKKQKILFSSFLFVSEFDELLMKNLESLNYAKFPNIVTYYLDVSWSNFEDYLKSLKARRRRTIRREIRECLESGVTIEEESISENIAEKLSALEANVSSKYTHTNNKLDPSFFMKLKKYAKAQTRLLVARKNDEIIGFFLALQHKDMLDGYMVGLDYLAQTNANFIYFNLVYYKPIQLAIDEKKKKIYYRYSSEKAKLNRGCRPEQTYSFVKCHNNILAPLMNSLLRNNLYSDVKSRFLRDNFKK
jgi:predicted N-acyltransferase